MTDHDDLNNSTMNGSRESSDPGTGQCGHPRAEFVDAWQPIETAPRDGTPINIRFAFGLAQPWFQVAKWADTETPDGMSWVFVHDEPHKMYCNWERALSWSPLTSAQAAAVGDRTDVPTDTNPT